MATFHVPEKKFNPLDPARTVQLRGEFNSKMVGKVGPEIRCLQAASTQPITLDIDSNGGAVPALDQILKIMEMERGGKRWAFVTVAGGQAASAAADLLALGDYIIADPNAQIHFHGARVDLDRPLTAELGQKCFCILIKNNNERSKKLFAGRVSRLLTRHTKLKKLINAVRKKVRKTKTISEIEIFAECLKSQLHGKEAKVIVGDCIYAWRKQRDLSKKILPGVSRTQKTLHEFELGVHDAINRSLLSKSTQSGTGLDEDLLEAAKNDFMLLKEYHAGYQHNFTVALMRIVARAFLSRTELENLASKNKQLANKSKKKLVEIYESLVKDLLFFTAYMCWRLSHGENPLSAQDAYWLGIIDEIKSVIPASQAVPVQKPMRRPSPRKKAAV